MMEAARSSNNEKLYRRATELAIQSRSGDRALRNARAWLEAYPESRDANRAVLRILVVMNRIADSASYLRREVELTPQANRSATFWPSPSSTTMPRTSLWPPMWSSKRWKSISRTRRTAPWPGPP
jgi:hypothetical protein